MGEPPRTSLVPEWLASLMRLAVALGLAWIMKDNIAADKFVPAVTFLAVMLMFEVSRLGSRLSDVQLRIEIVNQLRKQTLRGEDEDENEAVRSVENEWDETRRQIALRLAPERRNILEALGGVAVMITGFGVFVAGIFVDPPLFKFGLMGLGAGVLWLGERIMRKK